jgi:hypothetical protein
MKIGLSDKEKSFQADVVWPHIYLVQLFLIRVVEALHVRIMSHDQSKLSRPEVKLFSELLPDISSPPRKGTFAHAKMIKSLNSAMDKHYANNRHHPEHHRNGIDNMDMVDLLEMLCDWKAVEGSGEFTIGELLEDARERHGIGEQLYNVLANTITNVLKSEI